VVLVATGFDDAIKRGEIEAAQYAANNQCEYLGFVNVYQIVSSEITDTCEVYSTMRESSLDSKEYLDSVVDPGTARTSGA
jgi:CTP synthase (UTP-ammonia lyase)